MPPDPFRAIADPSRRRILALLAAEDLPLNRLERHFSFSRQALLKHVRVLKACRLVRVRRRGRESIHGLDVAPLRDVVDWVGRLEAMWTDSLQRLKALVEAEA